MNRASLLFDPPRLVKIPRSRDLLEIFSRQTLSGIIYALHPGGQDSFSVQRSDDTFFLRSALPEEQEEEVYLENIDFFALLELGETLALNSQGFVYFNGQDICHQGDLSGERSLTRYPFREKGQVLGLHASKTAVHLLWHKNSGRVLLSHFRRDASMKVLDGKNALPDSASYATLENRGEKSVLLATTNKNHIAGEIDFLLTLDGSGLGHPHYLREDVSLALRALDSSGERFLAPGEKDGEYFFLDPRTDSICYLEKDGLVIRVADGFRQSNCLAIRSVENKCLLLQQDSLVLFNKDAELFRLSLGGHEKYDTLSFAGNRAMLFKRGDYPYMEVLVAD